MRGSLIACWCVVSPFGPAPCSSRTHVRLGSLGILPAMHNGGMASRELQIRYGVTQFNLQVHKGADTGVALAGWLGGATSCR